MQTFNLPEHISGDTWVGIPSLTASISGYPVDLTDAYVDFHVKFQIDAPLILNLSTSDNSIIITDSNNGILEIPSQIVDIPPAKYIWSLKVTLSGGEVNTIASGNWDIIKMA